MAEGGKKRKMDNEESKGDLNIFEWNVANFRQVLQNASDDDVMTSPVFVGKSIGLPNSFWEIKLRPQVEDCEEEETSLQVTLVFRKEFDQHNPRECPHVEHNPVVNVHYQMCLLDRNQQAASGVEEVRDILGTEAADMGLILASHSELLDRNNNLLDDDVLRIQIKLWIPNDEINAAASKKQNIGQLNKDLIQLLGTSKFSDLDIEVEDLTLKVHKNILSCRSPVFAAMFQNEMSESLTSSVKIEDFSSKTVKGMLEFIYSENVQTIDEDFMELLKIAEKYELEELKFACTEAAIFKMSMDNVMELLILGDMYNTPELKYSAMAFINSNKANTIFSPGNENGAFEKLADEHPKLLIEMYRNLRNNDFRVHYSGGSNETFEEVTRFTTNLKH